MDIFLSNLKRLSRDKSSWITMFLVPILFISMYFFIFSTSGGGGFTIGWVDEDQTEFTQIFKEHLENSYQVKLIFKDQIQEELIKGRVDYIVELPKGYTKDLIEGRASAIIGYGSMDTNRFLPLEMYIESYLKSIYQIGLSSQGEEQVFLRGVDTYHQGRLTLNHTSTGTTKAHNTGAMGLLVLGILFFSVRSTTLIMKDKKSNVFTRLLTTPLGIKKYMLENIISFILVSIIQIISILLIINIAFNISFGSSLIALLVILILFAITSISLGISLVSLVNDISKINTLANLIITPMLMLGGAIWPRQIMPRFLQNIGYLNPVTWAMEGIEGAIFGKSLVDMWLEVLILIGFSTFFFLLGTWKKEDIAQ